MNETEVLQIQREVRQEKLDLMYRSMLPLLVINVIIFAVDGLYFADTAVQPYFSIWSACVVAVVIFRALCGVSYRWRNHWFSPLAWSNIFAVGATLTGLMWGLSIFVLVGDASVSHYMSQIQADMTLQTIIIVAIISGGFTISGAYLPAAIGFIASSLPLVGLYYLTQGDSLSNTIVGVLALLYAAIILGFAIQFNRLMHNSIVKRLENEHLAQRLEAAVAVSDQARKAQAEFIVNVSHEIKTPMTGLIGTLDLAFKSQDQTAVSNYLNIARQSGRALVYLINDILDMAKLGSGQFVIKPDDNNIVTVVKQAKSLMQALAEEKGLDLTLETQLEPQQNIQIDAGRLTQVLVNLIGNAIKFTDKGHVTVYLSTTFIDEKQDKLLTKISVTDSGIGMEADKIGELFTRFVQLDGSKKRTHGGTGLGLAISKDLIEMMGGTIAVQSVFGQGSTFDISFIADLSDDQNHEAIDTPQDEQVAALGGRVLIVDDNAINRMILEKMTKNYGLTADVVDGAAKGLDLISSHDADHYGAILMDIQMPEMDGIEALTHIRALGGSKAGVPVIAVTANSHGNAEDEYHQLGFDDYVSKPIDDKKLRNALEKALNKTA